MAAFVPSAAAKLADILVKPLPLSARNRCMKDRTSASFGQASRTKLGGKQGTIKFKYNAFIVKRTSNQEPRPMIQDMISAIQHKIECDTNVITTDEVEESKMQKELDYMQQLIDKVRLMLNSIGDGEISVSAYDTAWVGMVEDEAGGKWQPRFPNSLEWIVQNQLPDGSWGDRQVFFVYDRLINTLACVIALKKWNQSPHKLEQGLSFLRHNICKLEEEADEHMLAGFEVLFPSLLDTAKTMSLDLPYDSLALSKIYEQQQRKLERIPMEALHNHHNTLLHSLEGLRDLNWEKLMKLQNKDGSFLFSPSSTAFALMQTKDEGCSKYLEKVVKKFNGGAPGFYPLDLFERIWVVDRLERLGIAQHFESEMKDYLDYVYRYWTDSGIGWAKNSNVPDLDDTCMGFRLLRKHGYEVSVDAIRPFEKEGKYFCHPDQLNEGITVMCNLNRACQLAFPDEKILKDAKVFSYGFLHQKQANRQFLDKWVMPKDLPGEVKYALDFPMYMSLPRVETRFYLDQYGGEKDAWIAKQIYRMPPVNNDIYMELAKLDFDRIQTIHRSEIGGTLKWYKNCNFGEYGLNRGILLQSYFLASSVIFEPKRAPERLAWTQSLVLMEAISMHLHNNKHGGNQILEELQRNNGGWCERSGLVGILLDTLEVISLEALDAHGRDIKQPLLRAWVDWLMSFHWVEDGTIAKSNEGELLVKTINLCGGRYPPQQQPLMELFSHPTHIRLTDLINSLSSNLRRISKFKENEEAAAGNSQFLNPEVETEMKQLIQSVFGNSQKLDKGITQTFLDVAKTFCYAAYCSQDTVEDHMVKVLFDRVA